jgi:uncharacterized protein
VAAIIMLVGAAVGAQVGAVATKYIKGYGIRIAFGLAVIGCFISIVLKLQIMTAERKTVASRRMTC